MSYSNLDRNYLVYGKALTEALHTNPNYTTADIEYVLPVFFNNCKNKINFLLHTYLHCFVGRFSLLYNDYIYKVVKRRNINGLINLINVEVKYMFPELYMNNNLTPQQKDQVEKILTQEYQTVNMTLQQVLHNTQDLDKINIFDVLDCSKIKIGDNVYQHCYKQVCSNDIFSSNNLPEVINIPLYIDPDIEIPVVHCVNFLELIKLLASDGINYNHTILEGIDTENINNLYQRFDTEIKMFKYYLRENNNI